LKQPIKQRQWIQSIADCQFPIADGSPCSNSKKAKSIPKIGNRQSTIGNGLSLRKLEPFPGALLTVFLSFLDARVARDQPRMFQGWTQIRIVLKKRSGYAVTNRARLSRWTTARHVNDQIKLISRLRQLQRLADDHAQCFVWKIAIKRLPVNLDFTGAGS
jgi:hypothetical protein